MTIRADLHVALSLVDQAFDKEEKDFNVTADELRLIRTRRVNEFCRLAVQFQREVLKETLR